LFALIIPPIAEEKIITAAAIHPVTEIPVRLIIDETRKTIKNAGTALIAPIKIPFLCIGEEGFLCPKARENHLQRNPLRFCKQQSRR